MAIEIRVPVLGESVVDAVVARWLKREGDAVAQGEALVELETEKINLEVAAEHDGVLQTILKQAGAVVAVGDVLGTIGEAAAAQPVAVAQPAQAQPAGDHRSPSPLARRIAAEYHVDLAQVRSSSTHGRVTKDDVIHYLEQRKSGPLPTVASTAPAPETPPAQSGSQPPLLLPDMAARQERVRLSRRRETIARRLVEVQRTAAMLTTFNEIDMSAISAVRARRKEAFRERYQVSLGFMSFFTRAVVGALKAFPHLNAEIEGNEMVLKHYYDIGIAVSTDEGLVVPVVREADRKSFAQLEREIADLARRARANTLSLADLQGGTFTITNGGVFGSLLSTPILNGPQVGILGMHTIQERPVVVEGQIVVRPMMYVALSYDHRIVDGSEAVRFLVRVKELAQDPEALLLEG
ncbi:MAG TPA: 2-oxoglutarate dehydrogenase complex dihydrolipoyllysine-residue succinyltransferase [Ktedonobacteraceae bacterium]|jgi:2-oxoglutarate dehydrogenase E2 component (dihydrolipoamide succinyltransferase)